MSRPLAYAALGTMLVGLGSALFVAIQQQEAQNHREKADESRKSNKGDLEEEEPAVVLPAEFQEAISKVKSLSISDSETLLKLYGLYKRVIVGLPNQKDKPWEPTARAKWTAWNDCRDLSRDDAVMLYVQMVDQLAGSSGGTAKKKQSLGPKVSKMAMRVPSEEEPIADSNGSNLFEQARKCDFPKLPQLLDSHPHLVKARDENGLTLLHWAVDNDDLDRVFLLAERGAEIDSTDFEDFTPLGYAASSGLSDIAMFLLNAGANARNASPDKPAWDLAKDPELKEKLRSGRVQ